MRHFFNKQTLTIAVAALVIIVAHYAGLLSWAERSATTLLNPVAGIFFRGGVSLESIVEGENQTRNLETENKRLETHNRELTAENISLHLLKDENEALRAQLQFYAKHTYRKTLANVVSRMSAVDNSQSITLDAGSADNVRPGQPVIVDSGILVGKIVSVGEHIAHACLITDINCHFAATIAERPGPSGLTQGDLGLTVRMDFVPQTEAIQVGDSIITSGLEASVPIGLFVGFVQNVQNEPNNLFQTAVIDPAADLAAVHVVSVITD